MFIYMYTYSLGPPVLHAALAHMHESCNDIFWPQGIHSMISPEFCWNQSFRQNYVGCYMELAEFRGISLVIQRIKRNFVNSVDGKEHKKNKSNNTQQRFNTYSRVFSENLCFIRNCHQQWWFSQTKTRLKTDSKKTHGYFSGNLTFGENLIFFFEFLVNILEIQRILQHPSDFLESSELIQNSAGI